MKKLYLTLGLLLLLPSMAVSGGTEDYCAGKWPDNYKMQEYCIDKQSEGNQELFSLAETYGLSKDGSLNVSAKGGDIERIFQRCMAKWELPKFKTYNFSMVVYCIKNQIAAYNRLKK